MGSGASKKCKADSNDANKHQKKNGFFVSAMRSLMSQSPETSLSSKPEPVKYVSSSCTDDINFPFFEDHSNENLCEVEKPLDSSSSENELEKREENNLLAAYVLEQAEEDPLTADHVEFDVVISNRASVLEQAEKDHLKDDPDAFDVVIGNRASFLDDNVKDISIDSFSVSARGKELLKDTSLKISHGKRYGLVGPNGTGKSALLKLLAWRKIPVPKNVDVLLVEQEVVGDHRTAFQAVVSANQELVKIRKEVHLLQNSDDDAGEKLGELYEKLQVLESDSAEAQASKILFGLGFTKEMQNRATRSFSDGWRMRISLARALFVQPALLLLDKPTNNLDLRAVLWLQEYLRHWKKTLVVVSHDKDFLNLVCSEIIHLQDLKLCLYRGVFEDFEKWIEQRRMETNKKFDMFDKQVKAAKKGGNRNQLEKAKGLAKIAAAKDVPKKTKSKGKFNYEAPLEAPKKWKDYSVQFHFPEPTLLKTESLIILHNCSFSYPKRKDFRLSNINVGINMDSRVAIVGSNGTGKTTLLNLLAGDVVPSKGKAWMTQNLRIGRYSQHFVDLLTMEETPVQYILRLHPNQEGLSKQEAVRSKLEKFGLPSHNHLTPISKLSDGQKSRVVFTSISMSRPHVLMLDKPTNHLDMESIDALALALQEFAGGVVLVSHDSRLISNVCENEHSTILVVENGTVQPFKGTFAQYKDQLLKETDD